jgi:hypothetical protein
MPSTRSSDGSFIGQTPYYLASARVSSSNKSISYQLSTAFGPAALIYPCLLADEPGGTKTPGRLSRLWKENGHFPHGGPGNIVIDNCPNCHIIWLDYGEIYKIINSPDGEVKIDEKY